MPRRRDPARSESLGDHGVADREPPERRRSKLRVWLVAALVFLLVVAVAGEGALAKVALQRRDASITRLVQANGNLTATNADLQAKLQQLTAERDDLIATRDSLAAERDKLASERDQLTAQRDGLNSQVADLQKQKADVEASLSDAQRQLGQAQSEGSRQQARASQAEAVSAVLANVVAIDDQIQYQFGLFVDAVDSMDRALARGDLYSAQAYYNQGMATAQRLDNLFAQRKQELAKLQP